ncbi:MAG: YebC/PmpR family DNA-binding transcriptional regulator, partial [Patescibacteria group bacterium]
GFCMSGHSKWSQIKRQKAVTDNRRAAVFTKLAKAISVAARAGGGDIDTNFKLRLAVQKAREANMPNDNVERAIKKGTGADSEHELHEVVYEGYGPDGIAVLIEAVTDNKNRTTSELRNMLSKSGGSLASTNSVAWQFEHKGIIRIAADALPKDNRDELQLALIDAGADDVQEEPEGWTIISPKESFARVSEVVHAQNITADSQAIEYIAKTPATLARPKAVEALIAELEEHDDIDNVYTNADLS